MQEIDIVNDIDAGRPEDDVILEADITFEKLDEIMNAHNFFKVDGKWQRN